MRGVGWPRSSADWRWVGVLMFRGCCVCIWGTVVYGIWTGYSKIHTVSLHILVLSSLYEDNPSVISFEVRRRRLREVERILSISSAMAHFLSLLLWLHLLRP